MPIPPLLIKFITNFVYSQVNRLFLSKLSDPLFHSQLKQNFQVIRSVLKEKKPKTPLWLSGLHYKAKLKWINWKDRNKQINSNNIQNNQVNEEMFIL